MFKLWNRRKKLLSEKAKLKTLSYYSKQKIMIEKLLIKMKKTDFTSTILRFVKSCGLSPRMRFDLTINHFVKSLSDGDIKNI